jgi:hypothetical protein
VEVRTPQCVAQDHHPRRLLQLGLLKIAPQQRLNAERREEVVGDANAGEALQLLAVHQLHVAARVQADALQRMALPPVLDVVQNRQGELRVTLGPLEDAHQPLRIAVGQGLQQYAIHHHEDQRVGRDRHGQNSDGNRQESGLSNQTHAGVAQVRRCPVEPREVPLISRRLHRGRHGPRTQHCSAVGFVVWQSAAAPRFSFHLEVKTQLRFQVLIGTPRHHAAKPLANAHRISSVRRRWMVPAVCAHPAFSTSSCLRPAAVRE